MSKSVKKGKKDDEKGNRRHVFNFNKDVYTDVSPIVNAFRSFWYQSTSDKNCNKARDFKIEKKMLTFLVSIIQGIPIPEAESLLIWQSSEIVTAFITKEDGTLMDDEEQLKKFCSFIFEKEGKVLCGRIYKENEITPYFTTIDESRAMNLMVIRWNSGSYGMSTMMNPFCRSGTMACGSCKVKYGSRRSHTSRCKHKCSSCFGIGDNFPCQQELADGAWIKCDKCCLDFKSKQCYDQHLISACKNQKKCKLCNHTYQIVRGAGDTHICSNSYCFHCNQSHPKNDRKSGKNYCYIQKAKISPKDFLRILYVFYDIETIQKLLKRLGVKRPNSCRELLDCLKKRRVVPNANSPGPSTSQAPVPSSSQVSIDSCSEDDDDCLSCSDDEEDSPSCSQDSGIIHVDNMENALPELAEPCTSKYVDSHHEDADEFGILHHKNENEIGKDFKQRVMNKYKGKVNFEHVANLLHSLIRCSDCINDTSDDRHCIYCKRVSSTFTSIPSHLLPGSSSVNIVHSDDVTGAFMEYLKELSQAPDFSAVYIYGHNAARFDTHFVLKAFTDRNYQTSSLIMKGNSIIDAVISAGQGIEKSLHFRDTFRIIPVALRAFQESFDLGEFMYKFDFPYLYNQEKNYGKVLDTLPHKKYFGYSKWQTEDKVKFDAKYDAECKRMEESGSKYYLPIELHKYCIQDVNILYKGFVEFRKTFNSEVQDIVNEFNMSKAKGAVDKSYYDVLLKGTTVASLCLYVYRLKYMPKNKIALIPETGYTDKTNSSKIASGYMEWMMNKTGHFIKHANNIGEHKIGKISVDGYNVDTKEILQIHGCLWHGCQSCYPDRTKVVLDGKTPDDFYAETVRKAKRLNEAIDGDLAYSCVKVIWECQIRREMNNDKDMFKFITQTEDVSNIDLRKTLSGGRTGPIRMQATYLEGVRKISYYDICSLYPYINFCTKYPVGHPEIKHDVPIYQYPSDIPEMAIIKVKVLCPENMELPLLPMKFRSQLIFPICGRCPELFYDNNEGKKDCPHDDHGRAFITTVTSQELLYAMHQGYKLEKIYHVLEYKEGSTNIFKDYVRSFLKMKIEASEPPANYYTDPEVKKNFEKLYKDIYDIELGECKKNSGRRFIAKLFLNSLWGRFALNVLEEKKIVSNEEYYNYVRDPTIFDLTSYYLADETRMIRFKRDQNYVTGRNVNIMLSLWTTAAAKIHLYKFMKLINQTPGCRILYTDTDSIIYLHPWNHNPLTPGELLGEMTPEYFDKEIIKYASAGAKQYHLELIDKNGIKSSCTKIRGITANSTTERKINADTFKYNTSKTLVLKNTTISNQ